MHLIVPDIHGEINTLQTLLTKCGILENGERVNHDVTVVQMGDLANSVRESMVGDLACLEKVGNWIDVYLLGNHETCHFRGQPEFKGFAEYYDVRDAIKNANPQVAYSIDDILITHSGVAFEWKQDFNGNAEDTANELNKLWQEQPTSRIFVAIGRSRGGWDSVGGIFWSDISEPKAIDGYRQIFGHTASRSELVIHPTGQWYCLDTYGPDRMAVAWVDSNGAVDVELFEGLTEN